MSEPRARRIWIAIIALAVVALVGLPLIGRSSIHHHRDSRTPTATTLSPKLFGTRGEIGTGGDNGNPRELFHGAFPSDADTQERRIGGLPARFSGYATWVRSVMRVPAPRLVDGYRGDYLRVNVTVFNRDTETQHVCACDFYVWTRTHDRREADAVNAPTLSRDTEMQSGARLDGNVYLYVGKVPGPYYVVYNPDAHVPEATSKARGVWEVPRVARPGISRSAPSSIPPAPPTTHA